MMVMNTETNVFRTVSVLSFRVHRRGKQRH